MPPDPASRARRSVVSARVLYEWSECERRLWLGEHLPLEARAETAFERSLRERGAGHERAARDLFPGLVGPIWRYGEPMTAAAEKTLRLLKESRAPLAQPVLLSRDGRSAGVPDFLYWDGDRPVIADAKLAHSLRDKPGIPLQLTHYARLLEDAAGLTPARLEMLSGKGTTLEVPRLSNEEYERAVAAARAVLEARTEPRLLLGHSECEKCEFYEHCWSRARAERRVEVLPSVWRSHVPVLAALGITTLEQLAARDPETLAVQGLGGRGPLMVTEALAWTTGEPQWRARPALPARRPLVWFDIEADPDDETCGNHVYLWGFALDREGPLEPTFVESHVGPDRDPDVWRRFLAAAGALIERHPKALWVHYAGYERTWVQKYAERHGDPDGIAARLLAAMWDLHGDGVMKWVRLAIPSYSIKWVAPAIGFEWSDPDSGSQWSIVQFRLAREAKSPAEREALFAPIRRYNAEDLEAMRRVWRWIEREGAAARERPGARSGRDSSGRKPRRRRPSA